MLGDFASYLISSEILLCLTASPYRSSLFAPPNEPPPFFDQLFATTLPGAFTATSFTTSKGQRASLFLSSEEEEQGGTYCSLWSFLHGHLLARIPLRSHGKSARSCGSDGKIFALSFELESERPVSKERGCFLGESNSVSSRTENFNWRYARCLEKDSSQRR